MELEPELQPEYAEFVLKEVLDEGRCLLNAYKPQDAVDFLEPYVRNQTDNHALERFDKHKLLPLYQLMGEAYLEAGIPTEAYTIFKTCAEIDPSGKEGGIEKFLWLGQFTGGHEGESWYMKGVEGLKQDLNELSKKSSTYETREEKDVKTTKLCEALLGVIEIWMTDLCMEPEAEQKCDKLITEALLVDDKNAESWSVLGSIRISQQRNEDAKVALQKSWDLYRDKLENTWIFQSDPTEESPMASEFGSDVLPMIRLAQNMMEMEMYTQVIEVTAALNQIDDEIAEPYFLHGLARFQLYKQISDQRPPAPRKAARQAAGARDAWNSLIKITAENEDIEPEMAQAAGVLLEGLPEVKSDDYTSSEEEIEGDLELEDLENMEE